MGKRSNTEDFIRKSNIIHNNKFTHELVEYIDAHTKVWITCPIHGPFDQKPNSHLSGRGCRHCVSDMRKLTNLARYGHENIAHGTKQENVKQTNVERYGFEYATQSKIIKDKIKATQIIRFGRHPRQTEEIQSKGKATNLVRYGVEQASQSEEIKTKIRNTTLERHGAEHYNQKHMIAALPLLQSKEWMIDQYVNQKKTLMQIGKELGVNDTTIGRHAKSHNIDIRPNDVGSSYQERAWIEGIIEQEGIFIQYSGNGDQYKIPGTRWKADGYCAETNTIYEFHGSHVHGNPRKHEPTDTPHHKDKIITSAELYQKTKAREQYIIDLGYNLVVMWDDGFTYSYHHPNNITSI